MTESGSARAARRRASTRIPGLEHTEHVSIHPSVVINPEARINVSERLEIGEGSAIGYGALIEGRDIRLGRHAWIDEYAHIGGGSCFEAQSLLAVGDFFHMGKYSHVNTARPVRVGDEVGLGIGTKVFSHGAYLSAFEGFPYGFAPVTIGSRVWLPHAWVNPGVTVGDDVVVAAMSLVNRDLPSGCLAGGIPVRILKEGAYPRTPSETERSALYREVALVFGRDLDCKGDTISVVDSQGRSTTFGLATRTIQGPATPDADRLRNILRRFGIRFRYSKVESRYEAWR